MADRVTTIGRILVEEALPKDLAAYAHTPVDKKTISALLGELADKHQDQYVEVLHKLMRLGGDVSTEYGNEASIGLEDLQLPPKIHAMREKLREKVRIITQNPDTNARAKNKQIVELLVQERPKILDAVQSEGLNTGNAFALSSAKGFRGNPTQLAQLLFGDIVVADHRQRPLPVAGTHGYGEGTTPLEFWAGSYGSRKGYADVQFATAETGYFGKQMALMAHNMRITGDDCGAKDIGIRLPSDSPDVLGRVLATDTGKLKAGTLIDKSTFSRLPPGKVLVRSTTTCQMPEGICKKCTGLQENGKYPVLGEFVGITAARAIAEPLTQTLGLSSKHTGWAGVKDEDDISGFDLVDQFLQVPQNFRGGAVLAPVDGRVQRVVRAPQGGHYVQVGGQQVYVPPNRTFVHKVGDVLEAGDVLTDGIPNPAEVVEHKGIGEGRRYVAEQFNKILKETGVDVHSRNTSLVSRSFIDKVDITEAEDSPDRVPGHDLGETTSYASLAAAYKPREHAEDRSPATSLGRFLEKPVLHYTIGTRVTPRVLEDLRDAGVPKITVHLRPPGFKPRVVSLRSVLSEDPDWKVRMAGFNLSRSLIDSATHGSTSPAESASFVPELMDPGRSH